MKTITSKELAALLNGRGYGAEITQDESILAKVSNLVVVYGASDDLMEFDGAIYDEIGCYEGATVYLDSDGIITSTNEEVCPLCGYYDKATVGAKTIKAVWAEGEYLWQYITDIPHDTFEIFKSGGKHCKGIVFSMEDLKVINED